MILFSSHKGAHLKEPKVAPRLSKYFCFMNPKIVWCGTTDLRVVYLKHIIVVYKEKIPVWGPTIVYKYLL